MKPRKRDLQMVQATMKKIIAQMNSKAGLFYEALSDAGVRYIEEGADGIMIHMNDCDCPKCNREDDNDNAHD